MRIHHILTALFIAAVLLQGCALSDHPIATPAMCKPSSSAEMERLIDLPWPIQFEAIDSAHWAVSLAGLLNLKSEAAVQAGLKDGDEPIQICAHLLKHPQRGNFLVDTGVSRKLVANPGKEGLNWVIQKMMYIDRIAIKKSTSSIEDAIAGQDAVCTTMEVPLSRKTIDTFSEGAKNVLTVMKTVPNIKLIAVTGIGAGDSWGHGGFLYDKIIQLLLLKSM